VQSHHGFNDNLAATVPFEPRLNRNQSRCSTLQDPHGKIVFKKAKVLSFDLASAMSSYLCEILVGIEVVRSRTFRGTTHLAIKIDSYRIVFRPRAFEIFRLSLASRFRNNSAAIVVMIAASFWTIGISGSSFIAFDEKRRSEETTSIHAKIEP
jgi:hypothetical protein